MAMYEISTIQKKSIVDVQLDDGWECGEAELWFLLNTFMIKFQSAKDMIC